MLSAQELLACARDPAGRCAWSPLAEPALLFEASGAGLSTEETADLARWLGELPCPVIAVGEPGSVLAQAADALVASAEAAAPLLANIRPSPIAASVLVQLLRLTAQLPLGPALTAESLAYSTLQSGPEFARWLAAHRAVAPAPHSDTGPAVLMQREEDTLLLTLNRASNRNAMTMELRDALIEALQLVQADDSIASVLLDARGKCFSTGGDLTEFGTAPDPATAHAVRTLALPGRELAAVAGRVNVRVHGACVGSGIEFPAFAGRIEAAADSWFQLPELQFGLIPGAGGCVSIARRIGRQRTAWLALSGARIKAATALDWGLVDALT